MTPLSTKEVPVEPTDEITFKYQVNGRGYQISSEFDVTREQCAAICKAIEGIITDEAAAPTASEKAEPVLEWCVFDDSLGTHGFRKLNGYQPKLGDKLFTLSPSAEQALRMAAAEIRSFFRVASSLHPTQVDELVSRILSLTNMQDTSAEQVELSRKEQGILRIAQRNSVVDITPFNPLNAASNRRLDGSYRTQPIQSVIYIDKSSLNWAMSGNANGIGQFSFIAQGDYTEPCYTSPPSADAMFNAGALRRLQDFSELMLHESGKTSVCYTCYTDLAKLVHDSLEPIITDLKRPTDMVVMSREELAKVQDALDSLASGTTDTKPPYRALNMCVSSRKIAQDAYKIVSRVKEGE
jgi:hypothetical protein